MALEATAETESEVIDDLTDSPLAPQSEPAEQPAETQSAPVEEYGAVDPDSVEIADPHEDDDTAVETEVAPEASTLSDDLLALGSRYGFTAEDAEAFGSPANFMRALTALDRKALAIGDPAPPAEPITQAAKPATQDTPAPTINSDANGEPFEKLKLELDPAEFDEQTISLLNGINDHYDKLLREQHQSVTALNQQLQQITGHHQAEVQQRFESTMDGLFSELGDEFKDIYGNEPMRKLPPNSPKSIERMRTIDVMEQLEAVDIKAGHEPCSLKELHTRAVRALHGDKIETTARNKVISQVNKRRSQAVARPASAKSRPLTGDQAAGKFAREFYAKHGLLDGDLTPDEI